MARPSTPPPGLFTTRDVALAAALSPREFSLLLARGVAPEPLKEVPGRGGHRLFCSDGLSHAAVISGIHHAGLELLVAARLAAMLVDHYNLGQNGNLANFPMSKKRRAFITRMPISLRGQISTRPAGRARETS